MFRNLDTLAIVIYGIYSLDVVIGSYCSTCDESSCEPPQSCLAGLVKDACNCCYVCGRKEGDRCDNEELNHLGFGKCGDNLKCLIRNDLAWDDPPEAACFCVNQRPLCGSDGVTYENKCQLTEARYLRRDGLRAVSADPCVKSPSIITAPENVRNSAGSAASMTCEASAWPIPTIQWFVKRNGILEKLPGNRTTVAVQSRSGPGVEETTSWLLFMVINQEYEGTYVCKAENHVGSDTANATVTITS